MATRRKEEMVPQLFLDGKNKESERFKSVIHDWIAVKWEFEVTWLLFKILVLIIFSFVIFHRHINSYLDE